MALRMMLMNTCCSRSPWAQMGFTGAEGELELDVHRLQFIIDQRDDFLEAVLEIDAMKGEVRGVPGEIQEVLDDPRDAFGLGFDFFQDLGEVDVRHFFLEHLDVARDPGEGGVDLVGHAGREEPDRGQLFRCHELLLEVDLVGDVLEDDDRPVGIQPVVEERRLGDVEDPFFRRRGMSMGISLRR